ncbi:cell cycle checkpoint control protein rad9a [Physocladia obscura]|uniref:Cell cycle checkpoint control protein rad9a n=1 Tax=Physocladia obscura TaxID=109957 RepID=A0AAD5SYH5_9FUNG|nr:cell cycle checkpoint control protein rad9a [Physocladia obscura]
MKLVFGSAVARAFGKCIASLAKIGDDLYIEVLPSPTSQNPNEQRMMLYTVNLARTAFCRLALLPAFFDLFEPTSDRPRHFKVLLKTMNAIFRNKPGSSDDLIEKCIIRLTDSTSESENESDDEENNNLGDRLVIELQCKYGVRKLFHLHYQPVEPLKASFRMQSCTNAFSAAPKIIQDWLVFFSSKLDEVSIGCSTVVEGEVGCGEAEKRVVIRSFTEDVDVTGGDVGKRSLATEISVDIDDFDSFDVFEDVEITFCLRDLKTALGFADGIGQSINAHFIGPGQPIIFSTTQANIFNAEFVLATNTFDNSSTAQQTQTPKRSQQQQQQKQKHYIEAQKQQVANHSQNSIPSSIHHLKSEHQIAQSTPSTVPIPKTNAVSSIFGSPKQNVANSQNMSEFNAKSMHEINSKTKNVLPQQYTSLAQNSFFNYNDEYENNSSNCDEDNEYESPLFSQTSARRFDPRVSVTAPSPSAVATVTKYQNPVTSIPVPKSSESTLKRIRRNSDFVVQRLPSPEPIHFNKSGGSSNLSSLNVPPSVSSAASVLKSHMSGGATATTMTRFLVKMDRDGDGSESSSISRISATASSNRPNEGIFDIHGEEDEEEEIQLKKPSGKRVALSAAAVAAPVKETTPVKTRTRTASSSWSDGSFLMDSGRHGGGLDDGGGGDAGAGSGEIAFDDDLTVDDWDHCIRASQVFIAGGPVKYVNARSQLIVQNEDDEETTDIGEESDFVPPSPMENTEEIFDQPPEKSVLIRRGIIGGLATGIEVKSNSVLGSIATGSAIQSHGDSGTKSEGAARTAGLESFMLKDDLRKSNTSLEAQPNLGFSGEAKPVSSYAKRFQFSQSGQPAAIYVNQQDNLYDGSEYLQQEVEQLSPPPKRTSIKAKITYQKRKGGRRI